MPGATRASNIALRRPCFSNTNLAGAAGAGMAMLHGWTRQSGPDQGAKSLAGALYMAKKLRFFEGETEVPVFDALQSLNDARS